MEKTQQHGAAHLKGRTGGTGNLTEGERARGEKETEERNVGTRFFRRGKFRSLSLAGAV